MHKVSIVALVLLVVSAIAAPIVSACSSGGGPDACFTANVKG
jgi:hypothetical protein